MVQDTNEGILQELDAAYDELKAARERLTELLPMSATMPGDSGQARVEFVAELDAEAGHEQSAEEQIRQISAAAWERAQNALVNAQQKVELAHQHLRELLSSPSTTPKDPG